MLILYGQTWLNSLGDTQYFEQSISQSVSSVSEDVIFFPSIISFFASTKQHDITGMSAGNSARTDIVNRGYSYICSTEICPTSTSNWTASWGWPC